MTYILQHAVVCRVTADGVEGMVVVEENGENWVI
jgi:hypothetical protein